MAIAGDALLVTNGFRQRLADGNADVLHGVVVINVQITLGLDRQIYQPVPRHLIEHVLKERHPRIELALAGAVEVDGDFNLGLQGVPADRGTAC